MMCMVNRVLLFILISLPAFLFSQNEQIISLPNGFALKCSIIRLDSSSVVFMHNLNGKDVIDSLPLSQVYKISYPNHKIESLPDFKSYWLDGKGEIVFTESDKRLLSMRVKLMQAYAAKSGRSFTIAGGIFMGTGVVICTVGGIISTRFSRPGGVATLVVGSLCITHGVVLLPIGLGRLQQAKAYQKVINQMPAELSMGPAVLSPTNFAMATAYGAGLRLSF